MHFIDAWRELSGLDLARLAAPLVFMALAAVVPGRRLSRVCALGVAASIPFLRELGAAPPVAAGWAVLWGAIAWFAGDVDAGARRPIASRAVFETGLFGIALALALVGLLIAAVARQDMSPEDSRRASFGVAFLGLGIAHLMLRRHARRAALAFAALGLGLQVLDGAAWSAQVEIEPRAQWSVLLATSIGVAIALRIASTRARYAGTGWVSDAHDLHD
jgi:hypothetical protein